MNAPAGTQEMQPGSLPPILSDAIAYWEKRRLPYNVILTLVVVAWVGFSWPHFNAVLSLHGLGGFFVLAILANICYCAAYVVDVAVQYSAYRDVWRRWRIGLWILGTAFAVLIANYWIVDEIYPYVRQ